MSREAGTSHESGTTALAAVVWGRKLYLANAGDSRAVLCNRGRAVELTRDHKPCSEFERQRIEQAGGYVCPEGLLNGELGVARAIGDYHFPGAKSLPPPGPDNAAADGGGANGGGAAHRPGPLSAEPETLEHLIAPEDEFLLLGCDGLWDVFPSQRAVEFARGRLREHNDVSRLAQELVQEALRMHTSDNVTVIAVCFGGEPPPARTYTAPFQRNISRDGLNRLASFLQP